MKTIALAAVNASYSHSNLALFYLRRALREEGVEAELIDWNINRSPRELIERLSAGGFGLVAFSAYIWNSRYLQDLLPDLRAILPEVLLVIGGPEAVYGGNPWLRELGVDYLLTGAAEHFSEQLIRLSTEERRLAPQRIDAPRRSFVETPFPYSEQDLNQLEGRLLYYEASRGCIFRCAYCLSARADESFDRRRLDQVETELALLVRFRGTVKFVDRTFNADSELSRFIWQYMIDHPPVGCFHFELHPLLLRDQDFLLLSRLPAGSAQFEIGIQSTDHEVRRRIDRSGDWPREREAIRRLIDINRFHIHLDQIVGLPGDSPETASRSLDEILALQPDHFQLGFLKLLPGTPLWERREAEGLVAGREPPYELLQSPDFSFLELQRFHRIETLIDLFYNKSYFPETLKTIAEAHDYSAFFSAFASQRELEFEARRWEYWAGIILDWVKAVLPEQGIEITDSLRLDWCPRAKALHYPSLIDYPEKIDLNRRKKEFAPLLKERFPEITPAEQKRAILFLPEGKRAADYRALFFLTVEGRPEKVVLY